MVCIRSSKLIGITKGIVIVVYVVKVRIKSPCFDSVFKFQFETVADRNVWDDEKTVELILALTGVAAEILETMPISRRNNYNDIFVAFQSKFGDENKRELYRMELRWLSQKANESLQAFLRRSQLSRNKIAMKIFSKNLSFGVDFKL